MYEKCSINKVDFKVHLKEMSFVIITFEMIVAVPPPLLPLLLENKKLKFGGEASVRSVLSHVSVKNKQVVKFDL